MYKTHNCSSRNEAHAKCVNAARGLENRVLTGSALYIGIGRLSFLFVLSTTILTPLLRVGARAGVPHVPQFPTECHDRIHNMCCMNEKRVNVALPQLQSPPAAHAMQL